MKYFLYPLLIFISSFVTSAQNLESLFDSPKYYSAKLSPDGKHIAVSILSDNKTALVFLEKDNLTVEGTLKLPGKGEIGQFYWVNNERVVIKVTHKVEYQNEPIYYGELFAINFDGSKPEAIYGYSASDGKVGTRLKKKESTLGWAEIISTLPNDDQHILISSTPMDHSGEKLASVLLLNVYTGIIKKDVANSPVPRANFISDNHGNLKAVVGTDIKNNRRLYIRKDNEWLELPSEKYGENVTPLTVNSAGTYLYTLDNPNKNQTGLHKLNLSTLEYKEVYSHDTVDITYVELTTDSKEPYALRIDENYPAYLLIDKKHEEAKAFKSLLQAFPYSKLNITSRSKSGEQLIVYASSDVNPGAFYLFDKNNNKLTALFRVYPEFNEDLFAQMEPIKFTADDGVVIHGFFTPAKKQTKETIQPLVMMVHGGPHGVRDYWGYNSEVQYLVNNGFSVLQINYRGSAGYGANFHNAGKLEWGDKVQADLYQAYQWLIKQGKALPNNACIMGGSFGAYSALQSSIKYPDTYRCAIANAGVYDLNLLYEEGDIKNSYSGTSYLREVLGEDEEVLRKHSPVYHVDKIKKPLLLAHGEKDKRAPFEHFERLKEALDKENIEYEWYVEEKATHGFHDPENKKKFMNKVVNFLQRNLLQN